MASRNFTDSNIELALNRDDGTSWYCALLRSDGAVVVADSLTELVADIVDDYVFEDTIEGARASLDARYDFAVDVIATRQAFHAFAMSAEGDFDPAVESEAVLTAIFAEKDQAVVDIEVWGHIMPLLLIATDYAPYTKLAAPTGNVQWVDPATELTLLLSLQELGDVELFINES
jgi:hypothetical protein